MQHLNANPLAMPGRAIRLAQVADLVGASKPTVRRWSKTNSSFPRPFHLSPGVTAWDENEVFVWIEARKAERGAA